MKKSARQYKVLLATVRPRDLAGKTCRRMAAEELEDLERLDVKLKAMKAELKAAVQATGSHLMDIHGIGPAGAARILADVGDVTRFPDRGHFASWNGTAPIDASSGQHTRHRLSRAGNRRINHVLYMAGIVQLRNDTPGRAYYRRKLQQSKTSMEAMRALRRRLSDAVYRQLAADAAARQATLHQTGPEGTPGRLCHPARPAFPGHRHFGSATSRTRIPDATPTASSPEDPRGPDSCHTTTARQRRQRGAPHWTNDVDTDQRRRTLDSSGTAHLTNPVIEGSHESASASPELPTVTECPAVVARIHKLGLIETRFVLCCANFALHPFLGAGHSCCSAGHRQPYADDRTCEKAGYTEQEVRNPDLTKWHALEGSNLTNLGGKQAENLINVRLPGPWVAALGGRARTAPPRGSRGPARRPEPRGQRERGDRAGRARGAHVGGPAPAARARRA